VATTRKIKIGCWYTPERRNEEDREKVLVRLTPRALHELYVETKDLSNNAWMHGHTAECDLCGNQVDLDRAIPSPRREPCHKHYWAEYTSASEWFSNYV
jgi:acetone carboxylase gamma subunit